MQKKNKKNQQDTWDGKMILLWEYSNWNSPYLSIQTFLGFNFLKIEIGSISKVENDCMLVLEQLKISSGVTRHTSLKKMISVTLPEHTGQPHMY